MNRALVAAILVACKVQRGDATPVDAAVATPSTSVATRAPIRSVRPDPFAAPRLVLLQWNAAHDAHDAKALEALYAPNVKFYGSSLSGVACAKGKAAAFAK